MPVYGAKGFIEKPTLPDAGLNGGKRARCEDWPSWQILVNGVLLGGLYALMALGLVLVWGVLNIVNLAHGALIMLGAYACYYLFTGFGIDPFCGTADGHGAAVLPRLSDPARRAQPGDPRADVQHAADHLRFRGRDHLSCANRLSAPISAPSIPAMPEPTSSARSNRPVGPRWRRLASRSD